MTARKDLRRTLGGVADAAHQRLWAYRQEALLQNPREPPAGVRVAELLSWSQTEQGKRLLALAELRRGKAWKVPSVVAQCPPLWKSWMGYSALAILLLPFAVGVDAVCWASWCSMILTGFGLFLPLLQYVGAPALPFVSLSTLWISLALYSLIAGSIWWNHLLGGARRWAVLSGQLAAQLVDQADAATGIAFLTRDWAEMARRSLAALDQELGQLQECCRHQFWSGLVSDRNFVEAGGRASMSWRSHLMI